jgi:2,3-bisphosphoglycerate-dependent phosphoglycerate mutase
MRHLFLLLAIMLVSCNNTTSDTKVEEVEQDNQVTTFYFIRHAEKDLSEGSDPGLTEKGSNRASQWVNYFFLKDVDHVISSDFNRTRQSAQPLATAKKLDMELYDARTATGKSLLEQYRGKTVVLFGHSNTINTYANDLQSDTTYKELDETDYDHYFIVRVDDDGNSSASKEKMDFME